MTKPTDVRPVAAAVYFLPIKTRMPLKFGPEITTEVTCARIRVTVSDARGKRAEGWGETPLSVQWVWPSRLSYEERHQALRKLTAWIAEAWISKPTEAGHPIELGDRFLEGMLPDLLDEFNDAERPGAEPVPWLGALVCASAFDLAVHDAYGVLHGLPTYETYNAHFMNIDLDDYLEAAEGTDLSFAGRYPEEFLVRPRPQAIPAWHLVGGKDPVDPSELTGVEPDDGYPVLLRDWIRRDGLKCLKVKLRGDDAEWDLQRLIQVGRLAIDEGVDWLTADFNCTVGEPSYVNSILDFLMREHPRLHGMMLYVEQPFPYDLEAHCIDVHSVSAQAPVHGRERPRLAPGPAGPLAGLDGGGSQDLQDSDRRPPDPLLGQGPWHDPHGPGPHEPHAGAGSSRSACGPCGHDHGRRVRRHAVLPRRIAARGCRPPRPLPSFPRPPRPLHHPGPRLRLPRRRDRAIATTPSP